jgi:hypothetical protein
LWQQRITEDFILHYIIHILSALFLSLHKFLPFLLLFHLPLLPLLLILLLLLLLLPSYNSPLKEGTYMIPPLAP